MSDKKVNLMKILRVALRNIKVSHFGNCPMVLNDSSDQQECTCGSFGSHNDDNSEEGKIIRDEYLKRYAVYLDHTNNNKKEDGFKCPNYHWCGGTMIRKDYSKLKEWEHKDFGHFYCDSCGFKEN